MPVTSWGHTSCFTTAIANPHELSERLDRGGGRHAPHTTDGKTDAHDESADPLAGALPAPGPPDGVQSMVRVPH